MENEVKNAIDIQDCDSGIDENLELDLMGELE